MKFQAQKDGVVHAASKTAFLIREGVLEPLRPGMQIKAKDIIVVADRSSVTIELDNGAVLNYDRGELLSGSMAASYQSNSDFVAMANEPADNFKIQTVIHLLEDNQDISNLAYDKLTASAPKDNNGFYHLNLDRIVFDTFYENNRIDRADIYTPPATPQYQDPEREIKPVAWEPLTEETPPESAITVTSVAVNQSSVPEGQNLDFQVQLSGVPTQWLRFAYRLGLGTALAGDDFSESPQFSNGVYLDGNYLMIPPGVSTFTVTVYTLYDNAFEPLPNETLWLDVGGVMANAGIIDVNVLPGVTSIEPANVGTLDDAVQEGQPLIFTVTLNSTLGQPAIMAFNLGGGTANGSDYGSPVFSNGVTLSSNGLNIIIPAGINTFTVTVPTINDGIYEAGANETVPITIGGVTAIGEIIDINSAPTVSSVEPGLPGNGDDAVLEGQTLVFDVSLSNISTSPTTFTYSLGNGSATAGIDYSTPPLLSNGVTFTPDGMGIIVPAGVGNFSVTVTTLADGIDEPGANETFQLNIGGTIGTGQIVDIDGTPSVASIEPGMAGMNDDAVPEGQSLVFNVTLSNSSSTTTNLQWSLGGGTATAGIDYAIPPTFSNGVTLNANGISLDVPAGVTSFSVNVSLINDGIYEPGPNETVPVTIGTVTAIGQIIDVNTPPAVVSIEPGNIGNGDDAVTEGQNLVFTVTLSNPSASATNISYSLGNGTATAGIDYTAPPTFSNGVTISTDGLSLVIPSGIVGFTVTVPTFNDGIYEPGPAETVPLTIGGMSAIGGIIDVNSPPTVTNIEAGPSGPAGDTVNEGQNLVFNVTLSNASSSTTLLAFSLAGGTATPGTDFNTPPTFSNGVTLSSDGNSIIVPAGVTAFSVTVQTLNDGLYEPGADETVDITVGGTSVSGNIHDTDTAPIVTNIHVGLPGNADDAVNEGDTLVYTVTLSNTSTVPITLTYSLGGGTADAGVDYSAVPSFTQGVVLSSDGLHVIVPAGVSSFSVSITTLHDGIYEPHPDETLPLSIGGVTAEGAIIDIDGPPSVISIEPGMPGSNDDAVNEGQNLIFNVSLNRPSSVSTSYAWNLGGGTATSGSDYNPVPTFSNGVTLSADGTHVIIPAGITSFSATIATLVDTVYEPGANETLPLSIGGINATGYIIDTNTAPIVANIEVGAPGTSDDTVNEGQNLVFNVTLSNTSTLPTTFAYSLGNGTASSGVDYSVPPTFSNGVTLSSNGLNLIVPAGVSSFSVTVATLNDGIYESNSDETVTLSLGGTSATGSIHDTTPLPTVISIEPGAPGSGDDSVVEGVSIIYTVTLSNISTVAINLNYSLGGGTATEALDYSAPPTFSGGVTLSNDGTYLIIPPGTINFTVSVATINDGIYEPQAAETLPLTVGSVTATASIIDINTPPTIASIEIGGPGSGDDAVNEGQNLVFNVTLSNASTIATSYGWSLGGGTASSGTDYVVPSNVNFSNGVLLGSNGQTLIVPAGVTNFSVTVPTLTDGVFEGNETVPIIIGGITAIGTIIDIDATPTVVSIEPGAAGASDDVVDEGQTLIYTINLSNTSSTATTLNYSLGGGTATSGADFSIPPTFSNGVTLSSDGQHVIVPAGVISFTVSVVTINDMIFESNTNETLPLTIGTLTATGEIKDLQTAPAITSVEAGMPGSSDDAVQEGQSLVFTVTLNNASSTATTMSYQIGGTATSGIDYSSTPVFSNGVSLNPDGTTLNIPAGISSFTVTYVTFNDGVYESHSDETVSLTIGGTIGTGGIIDINTQPTVVSIEPGNSGAADDAVQEGQNLVFNVTLSNSASMNLSYAWSIGGGTAISGSDFTVPVNANFTNGVTLSSDGLSIIVPAGVSSFSVTVPLINDGLYEPGANETVPITVGGLSATAQIIDINNAPTVTSIEPSNPGSGDDAVSEGQNLVFTVNLSNPSSTTTTLAYSLGGGSAASGTDFSAPPTFSNGVTLSNDGLSLIVPVGVTSFIVTVPTLIDNLYESGGNETVPLSVGGITGTGQIIDLNTAPTVTSVEPGLPGTSDDTVLESQNLVFTVNLSNPSATASTLAYSLGGGTATSGADYTAPPLFSNGVTLNPDGISLNIPANVTSFTITVPTLADGISEAADESVPLSVGGVSSTGYISDIDAVPHISSIEPGSAGSGDDAVNEGQNLVYTVTLSGTASGALSYAYSLGGGTAASGIDYSVPPTFSNGVTLSPDGLTIIVPANVSSFTVTVPTLNDGIYEPGANETLPLSIGGISATGQIVDINAAPTVTSVNVGGPGTGDDTVNEGQTFVFNVTLSNTSSSPTTLTYSLGGGTASSGVDFNVPPTFSNGVTLSNDGLSLIVPAGVSSFSINVATLNDGIYEPGANETVPLSVGGISNTGQIVDMNIAPTIASVEPGAPGTGDDAVTEGQTIVFNVALSNASSAPISFDFALAGTATTGIDYTVPPTFSNGVTLNADGIHIDVPAGVSSFSVSYVTLNDGIYEPGADETLSLTVGNITGIGQIVDINSAPTVSSIEPGNAGSGDDAVTEGQNLVFTVTLSNPSTVATSLAYSLGGGTATGGIDYTVPTNVNFSNGVQLSADHLSLLIPAGVSSFTVTVPTLNDGIYEPGSNETLPLSIGGVTATGQIIDTNTSPTVVSVEPGAAGAGDDAVNEGQNLVFTVNLSNTSSTSTTLTYSLGNGTATNGLDFTVPPTFTNGVTISSDGISLIVPAGVSSFTVTVPTLNDGTYEPGGNETVPLSVGGMTGIGQIVDLNTTPVVTGIEPGGSGSADDAVAEGQTITYHVTLSNASTTLTTIPYTLGNGTATSGLDFTVPPTFTNGVTVSSDGLSLLVPAGVTSFNVIVATVDDTIYEPGANETVPLTIGGVTATGMIIDNDSAPTVTSITPSAAVNEGQTLSYNVALSNTSTTPTTLAYSLGGGTATASVDYSVTNVTFTNGVTLSGNGLSLIIPAGVSSFSVNVPTLNDGIYEPGANETLPLSIGGVAATGQIIDVNSAPTVSSVEPGNPGSGDDAINEGQNIVYTVTLSNGSSVATTLAYNLGGGTATSGSDYTAPPTFSDGVTLSGNGLNLIVPAGVTSFTVTVPTLNDGVYEPGGNETVPLTVGGVTGTGQIIDLNTVPTVASIEPGAPGTSDDAVNEGQNLVFNVTLTNKSTVATTLAYSLAGGSASSGNDYTSPPTFSNGVTLSGDGLSVIVPAGVNAFSVTVHTLNDGLYEPGPNETVQLNIGGAGGITSVGQIIDINSAPTVSSIEVGNAGTADDAVLEGRNLVYQVTLSNPSAVTTTLAYTLGGGTATSGTDYTTPPTFSNGVTLSGNGLSLIIPAGVTSFTVTVPTINDGTREPGANETLPLSIGGVTTTGQIIDNAFYVSEEGLSGANPDTAGTPTDFTNSTSVTSFIGINSISTIVLAGSITSGGNVISATPVLQGDGSYSFGYTSGGNFIQVANFKLDGNGNFTFNLLKAIDHPATGVEDTLLFPVRVNNVDIGLYIEDDSPLISNTFTQVLVPTLSENVAPVVNNPSAPNLLGLANVGLPSVVVSADLLSAASATISLTDYAGKQAFTAYDTNNNLQKVLLQYSPLINLGLPAYSFTYSSDVAAAFGLQIRSLNDQGVVVAIGLGTRLEITSLDNGPIDNLAINQFLNTVHFNSSGLLSLDVLSSTSIIATDMLGATSQATVGSLLSLNLLNPASYAPIAGGTGNDTLSGTSGNDQMSGGAGNDSLSSLAGNDVIFGNDGDDRLDGGTGNDLLMGGTGNDTIIGGTGNDLIYGGAGNDTLTGGANNDFFVFTVADKGNLGTPAVDTITDFSKTEDYLDLRNLLQGENTASIQKFISIENSGGNTIIHISSNGGFVNGYSATQENQTIILTGTFTQTEVMSRLLYDANALTGTLSGSFGADGGYVSSLTMEGTTYTYNASTNTITSSNSAISANYDANTHILTINTSIGEKITVNVLNGNYSYLDTSAMHVGQYSTLNYTLRDFDGDTSSARLEFAGQQAYPATAPVVNQQVSGSLLGLVNITALQTSSTTDLIDLKSQQIFTAYDVNNNLQSVEIKYAGVLGLLGTYNLTASTALADQLGLHISIVNTAGVSVLGTPVLAPTSTLTITANGGGVIDNFDINQLLGTVTFTHTGLLNDVLSAQLLSATTIKATDSTGLSSSATTGSLADISLLTGSQTTTIALEGTTANDNITGSTSSDRIYGYAGNDNLNGGNGNDLIHGGAGGDTIYGGAGNDIIIGGSGADMLYGGLGADVFRWELNDQGTTTSPVTDTIADFSVAAYPQGGDVLDLRDLLIGESHLGTDPGNLANYLSFTTSGADTTIKISTNGDISHGFNQILILQNVDLVSGTSSDQQVIANLLAAQKLVVD